MVWSRRWICMRRRIRYQQVVFEQAGLSAGSHVLVVTNTGTTSAPSGGTYVDLDAVDAEGAVVPVVLDRFEDTDAELVFSATGWWRRRRCSVRVGRLGDDDAGCVVGGDV